MASVVQNPMKSTWHTDQRDWTFAHKFLSKLDPFTDTHLKSVPVYSKTAPVPHMSQWSCHLWVLAHCAYPMAIQIAWTKYSGHNPHPLAIFALYNIALTINSLHMTHIVSRLALTHGYLDGDRHPRDKVPDQSVARVALSLQLAVTLRPMLCLILSYQRSQPNALSWWLPVELALYAIAVDFWFYVYHRACHEIPKLWDYHRVHHLTKHPNPMLTIFAGNEQEVIETVLVPLMAWYTVRLTGFAMPFFDLWICHSYVMFSEIFGHSGLRVRYIAVGTASLILRPFDCELVTEDHDLHHRHGWKKASNYGKQTRLWDRIFGTSVSRIEMREENIDYNRQVHLPLL